MNPNEQIVVSNCGNANGGLYEEFRVNGHELWCIPRALRLNDFDVTIRIPEERASTTEGVRYLVSGEISVQVVFTPSEETMAELRRVGTGSCSLGHEIFGNHWDWHKGKDRSKLSYCRNVLPQRLSLRGLKTNIQKARRFNNIVRTMKTAWEAQSAELLETIRTEIENRMRTWCDCRNAHYIKIAVADGAHGFDLYEGGKDGLIDRAGARHLYDQLEALRAQAKGLVEAIREKLIKQAKAEWIDEEEDREPQAVIDAVIEALEDPDALRRSSGGFHRHKLI